MPIHSLDKEAIRRELVRLGWKVGNSGGWTRPIGLSDEEAERDWDQAIICGIRCTHEDRRLETIKLQREERKRKHTIRGGDLDTSR